MQYKDLLKDFTKRTKRNLEVIEQLQKRGEEVYEVTQLVNSCLGLLVFPKERFIEQIPETPLEQLEKEGWPVPKVAGNFRQAQNLKELICYLRNAIAHFNIEFKSTRDEITQLIVSNKWRGKTTWKAELTVDDLRKLVEKFSDLIISK
ncbi:HEPN family nuclease [Thermodesulfovibrio sp.]|uniref:HEPN family nuclease n=1 Tax=Thermodesulfovibrio sp. TaxID=2067987 RepID=UPI0030B621C3